MFDILTWVTAGGGALVAVGVTVCVTGRVRASRGRCEELAAWQQGIETAFSDWKERVEDMLFQGVRDDTLDDRNLDEMMTHFERGAK